MSEQHTIPDLAKITAAIQKVSGDLWKDGDKENSILVGHALTQLCLKIDALEQAAKDKTLLRASQDALLQATKDKAALQAKIDSLMLEYCEDEMTKEQMDNWGNHQRAVPEAGNAELVEFIEKKKRHCSDCHNIMVVPVSMLITELGKHSAPGSE